MDDGDCFLLMQFFISCSVPTSLVTTDLRCKYVFTFFTGSPIECSVFFPLIVDFHNFGHIWISFRTILSFLFFEVSLFFVSLKAWEFWQT